MNIEETRYKFVVAEAFGMFTCDHNLVTLERRHPSSLFIVSKNSTGFLDHAPMERRQDISY